MRLNCEYCGDLEYAILDGYLVGERLLEGVHFKITIVNHKVKAEPLTKDDLDYLKGLNLKKWVREATELADNVDNDSLECPICYESGGWVMVVDRGN